MGAVEALTLPARTAPEGGYNGASFTCAGGILQVRMPEPRFTDAIGTEHARAEGSPRIVSLVPSVTELLCALGLGHALVGRTGFCVHPREALRAVRKVGGTKDVRIHEVRALEPTHLIVNIDENRRETVDELAAFVPHVVVTHPCMPDDNPGLYALLGGIFGREAEAAALCADFASAHAEALAVGARLAPESVLYLIWREPWMTVSRATYISAMLASVGWQTWPDTAAARYPAFEWSDSSLAGVQRVLLSSEPYRFRDRHLDEVARLSARPVTLVDGEMASWYGSRAIAGLRYLAELRQRLAAPA